MVTYECNVAWTGIKAGKKIVGTAHLIGFAAFEGRYRGLVLLSQHY